MELSKGLNLEYADGKVVLSYEVKAAVLPFLVAQKAKVENGEFDPIKGTDLDKLAMLSALDMLIKEIEK